MTWKRKRTGWRDVWNVKYAPMRRGNATAYRGDIVTAGPLWSLHSGASHSDQGTAGEAGSLAGPSRCLALQRRNQPNTYEAPGCQGTKISSERLFCIFSASWIP